MTLMKRLIVCIVGVLIATPALAQDCDAILRGGAFNEAIRNSTYDSRDIVMRFACNNESVRTGGGATAIIYGVPVSGNAYQNKVKAACDQYNRSRYVSTTDFSFVREASAVLANAWSACVGRAGINLSLQQSPNIRQFLVSVAYRKTGPAAPNTMNGVLSLLGGGTQCTCAASVGGSTCAASDKETRVSVPDAGTQSLLCERKNSGGILFALDSDIDQQKRASLPPIGLAPLALVTPERVNSGGKCSYRHSPIGSLEFQVSLYDFETPPVMSLAYRGESSNIGVVALSADQVFHRNDVRMRADRRSSNSGLYLSVGGERFWLVKQSGNYDCAYDRGMRLLRSLRITPRNHNPFPAT